MVGGFFAFIRKRRGPLFLVCGASLGPLFTFVESRLVSTSCSRTVKMWLDLYVLTPGTM